LEYKANPSNTPFDINSVSTTVEPQRDLRQVPTGVLGLVSPAPSKASIPAGGYSEALQQIAEFAGLGVLFRSSKPLELTEAETEYVVNAVKHIFLHHVVFQFNCTNTVNDQLLEGVTVKMEVPENFVWESESAATTMAYQISGVFYVCVRHKEGEFPTGTFANTLKFSLREVDLTTGRPDESSHDDDYSLEDIEVTLGDYMKRTPCSNFKEEWETLGNQAVESFNLSTMGSIKEAVTAIIDLLGMQPCDNTENVAGKSEQHQLLLSGTFVGDVPVLVRVLMVMKDASQGVNMRLAARSTDPVISKTIASAF